MKSGYPDDNDIEWLKEELSSLDFHRGAEAIKLLIDSTFYGHADIKGDPVKLIVTTGGWSGCEEIMDVVFDSLWRMKYWESIHRGGKFIFTSEGI